MGGHFPYHAISYARNNWNERARELVRRVAIEAGAQQARAGALFIATSTFDIGAGGTDAGTRFFAVQAARLITKA